MIKKAIAKEIFRAYDIRGVFNKTLTVEAVTLIGSAIGVKVLATGKKQVVIGRDGRLSGPTLRDALSQGIRAVGCDVIDVGLVPTPVLYFATHHLEISSGVMITGSHNPMDYNGLKIMIDGEAIHGETITELYHLVEKNDFPQANGSEKVIDVEQAYLQTVAEKVQLSRKLKIVVDSGNGVAGKIAPLLYQALGCEVVPLYCEIDGTFPNHHPDPGQPKNLEDLIQSVQQHEADLGLAFDGDGDRLGVVDNTGKIIWPDRQLILFVQELLGRIPKAQIIFDVKCSRHVGDTIVQLGGVPIMWKTGHSLIKAKMKETGAPLAGEMSGHVFFKDRWYGFDDGLYTGARLLEILADAQMAPSEIFAQLPDSFSTPELVLPTTDQDKFSQVKTLVTMANFKEAKVSTIDGLRVDFTDGFGLIRASNTGPNLILRFEGDTPEALHRIQQQFREMLVQVNPKWELPF